MKSKCEVERFPHRYTLSVRFRSSVGELPERFAAAYGAVMRVLSARGGKASGPPFAIYHSMDPQGLEVEAGLPVDRPLSGSGEVRAGELPGGRSATTVYTGPYRSIGVAYDALSSWLEEHGLQPNGDPCEFYLNDPSSNPPEQLQTKLVMPVRDSRSRSRRSEHGARAGK